jgi:RNA polymerase sigma-70 factor (ECF subfamily)
MKCHNRAPISEIAGNACDPKGPMHQPDPSSDEELLTTGGPEAFGIFYDRHVRAVLAYFARRTHDPEVAADLTAETFASALVARRRFKAGGPPAGAWLFAIAARRLADYRRKGMVDDRIRRSLAMERRSIGEEDARMIRWLAEDSVEAQLTRLPDDQRIAVAAHVIDERPYDELASELQVPEATVRQRVSRGLAALRRGGTR